MTFLVQDSVRVDAGTVTIGGNPLQIHQRRGSVCWHLLCGSCACEVSAGTVDPVAGPLLAGSQALPPLPGQGVVSWVWGTAPASARGSRLQVVFGCGFRRPAVSSGHLVADGMWVAAAPVLARRAIAVGAGSSAELRTHLLIERECPVASLGRPQARRRTPGRPCL